MSLTPEQRILRRGGLAATDIVAIHGMSPSRAPLDVYLEKTGEVAEVPASAPARIGSKLEPVILALYLEDTGLDAEVRSPGTLQHPTIPWALATPDYHILPRERSRFGIGQGDYLLETKSRSRYTAQAFGEPWTDEVPADVLVQVHWQLFVTGLPLCHVAVLVDASRFIIYEVQADAEAAELLLAHARAFWEGHVLARMPPPVDGSRRAHQWLAQHYREHTAELARATPDEEGLLRDLQLTTDVSRRADKALSLAQVKVKEAIADRAGLVSDFGHRVTWKAAKPSRVVDWQALARSLAPPPGLVEQFTTDKPGSRRFLTRFAGAEEEDNGE